MAPQMSFGIRQLRQDPSIFVLNFCLSVIAEHVTPPRWDHGISRQFSGLRSWLVLHSNGFELDGELLAGPLGGEVSGRKALTLMLNELRELSNCLEPLICQAHYYDRLG